MTGDNKQRFGCYCFPCLERTYNRLFAIWMLESNESVLSWPFLRLPFETLIFFSNGTHDRSGKVAYHFLLQCQLYALLFCVDIWEFELKCWR